MLPEKRAKNRHETIDYFGIEYPNYVSYEYVLVSLRPEAGCQAFVDERVYGDSALPESIYTTYYPDGTSYSVMEGSYSNSGTYMVCGSEMIHRHIWPVSGIDHWVENDIYPTVSSSYLIRTDGYRFVRR